MDSTRNRRYCYLMLRRLYPRVQCITYYSTILLLLLHYYHYGCSILAHVKPTITHMAVATHHYIYLQSSWCSSVLPQKPTISSSLSNMSIPAGPPPNNHTPLTSYLQSMYRLTQCRPSDLNLTHRGHSGDIPGFFTGILVNIDIDTLRRVNTFGKLAAEISAHFWTYAR